jgi:5'(3')-deoxyribonucleotidase
MNDQQRISIYEDFMRYCYRELGIKEPPRVKITRDKKFVKINHSFGGYIPDKKSIIVYDNNRNLADCLRTLAHELVHHGQNEKGLIKPDSGKDGSEQENEANSKAGVILRTYGRQNPVIYENTRLGALMEDLKKYQLYCDMDGVLCDFDAQFDKYFGTSPQEYIDEKGLKAFENAIESGDIEFWSTMPWFPGSQELWKKIAKHGPIILSSPSSFSKAKEGKMAWIEKNLNPAPKQVIFKQTGQKHEILANKSPEVIKTSVLIDDYGVNLKPWKEAGGIGIKHENQTDTSHALQKLDK